MLLLRPHVEEALLDCYTASDSPVAGKNAAGMRAVEEECTADEAGRTCVGGLQMTVVTATTAPAAAFAKAVR